MRSYLKNKWLWVQALFLAATPFVWYFAWQERGYSGMGGEVFFPLAPLLVYAFVRCARDSRGMWR